MAALILCFLLVCAFSGPQRAFWALLLGCALGLVVMVALLSLGASPE